MAPSAIEANGSSGLTPPKFEDRLFINNEFVPSKEGKRFDLSSPFTEGKFGSVYEALPADVDLAVDAAEAAFPAWSELGSIKRAAYFYKLADLLEKAGPELAELEAWCSGKPVGTYSEHLGSALLLRQFAGLSQDVSGGTSMNTEGFVNLVVRQPFGVCGAIVPWNIPILAAIFKIAPALITGNTLVLKSSEKTPLTALVLARLIKEAGFPPGVCNILSGFGRPCGEAIASHMRIRKVGFTGSGRTGRAIKQAAAASNLKRVSLELGGKSPMIIFPDADLDKAVPIAARSITTMSGQMCIASSRVYVHSSIADAFRNKLADAMNAAARNPDSKENPLEKDAIFAPQADKMQFEQVLRYIELAKESGGKIVLGGKRLGNKGYFIEPTIIENPAADSKVVKEEIFGPVLSFMTFEDEDEVMTRANDTEFGLYATVFTKDLSRALRIAKRFESGQVGINTSSGSQMAFDTPFSGWKASGDGVDMSKAAIDLWTQVKSIYIAL